MGSGDFERASNSSVPLVPRSKGATGNKATFCRNLNAAVVLKQVQRSVGGKWRRFYAGIRLVEAIEKARAEGQEGLF